jgi:hypothetical protein
MRRKNLIYQYILRFVLLFVISECVPPTEPAGEGVGESLTNSDDWRKSQALSLYSVTPLSIHKSCSQNHTRALIPGTAKTVPEIIDPVFAKTSQNARFLLSENERFGLVFVKTGSINSGTGHKIEMRRDF